MNGKAKAPEHERRDWAIILIILLFGFLCVIIAGERAVRFSPNWKLNTSMLSNLDPDSDFLTNKPVNYYEPLDPAILTQPVWADIYLTPGTTFEPGTPPPAADTPIATNTFIATAMASPTTIKPTNTPTVILPSPTNTSRYFPPPTRTSTPRPPGTNTPVTPASPVPVDLQVTKTDFPASATYTAGAQVTYTIVVTNNGLNNVTGATISDPKPAQVTSWTWACTSVVSASGCDPAPSGTANFTDTVNIQSGGSITYTVQANTNPAATPSDNLVNTVTVSAPSGYTDTVPGNNSATDTNTPAFSADLQIGKTDNSTDFVPNATKTYVIQVINNGPSNVTGATVTDNFSANPNIAAATWMCSGSGGATCTTGPVSGDISDTVNLPVGATVTYTVAITVSGTPTNPLTNTASVATPVGVTDPVPGNNSATDTDTLITADSPPLNMGSKDNIYHTLPSGSTLTLPINLVADGNPNPTEWDLVFYEFSLISNPPPDTFDGIWLDWIVIQIGDGSNWYTVFYWGDNISDNNTNVAHSLLSIPVTPPDPEEVDQRPIAASDLYGPAPVTGIAINIDGIVPNGTYTYIRFYAPLGDADGGTEIDAFEILP